MPTTRSPRLTLDSLEGTPVGACWSAQKDASASRSRYMAVLPCPATRDRIIASTAVGCQLIFRPPPHTGQASVARALRHRLSPAEGGDAETYGLSDRAMGYYPELPGGQRREARWIIAQCPPNWAAGVPYALLNGGAQMRQFCPRGSVSPCPCGAYIDENHELGHGQHGQGKSMAPDRRVAVVRRGQERGALSHLIYPDRAMCRMRDRQCWLA